MKELPAEEMLTATQWARLL